MSDFRTFLSLGVKVVSKIDKEAVCECIFCGSPDKLYINSEEGLYDCKVCGLSGNKYTFLQHYYDFHFEQTKPSDYKELSKERNGLHWKAFQMAELAFDSTNKLWIIPVRNEKGTVVNLRRWNPDARVLLNTAGCFSSLYNVERINHKHRKVYICEGEWDAIAMEYFLFHNKIKDAVAIAAPGAGVFREQWMSYLSDRELILCYDNDEAGRKGCTRTMKIIRNTGTARSIHKLEWPEGTPDKFDLRDHITKNSHRLDQAWQEFNKLLVQQQSHNREEKGIIRHTFESVVKDFEKVIFLPEDAKNALLLEFAVIFSNQIPGDPLWLFIVGPPGGGKTLMLQSVSDTDDTHYESSLSPKLLVSGFKTTDGSDPSLLPKIIGKTLVIKEYTEVMGLSATEQDQIFAVLRGAYDGRVERTYAHGVHRIYPEPGSKHKTCHFSMLAGVTNVIHGNNRAALGERFLKYQMFPDNHDPIQQIKSAIHAAINQELPEFELREPASAFIEHKLNSGVKLPSVPMWIQERVIGLSQIVSVIRATVSRKQGELVYRPAPEIGTRLSKQLIKLGQCVGFVLDKTEVDEECYKLVQRVALDTCYGWHRDIVMAIANAENRQIAQKDIYQVARLAQGTGSRCLNDLYELGAIDYIEEDTNTRGRKQKIWTLSELLHELFEIAQIDNSVIQTDIPKHVRNKEKKNRILKC